MAYFDPSSLAPAPPAPTPPAPLAPAPRARDAAVRAGQPPRHHRPAASGAAGDEDDGALVASDVRRPARPDDGEGALLVDRVADAFADNADADVDDAFAEVVALTAVSFTVVTHSSG